MESTALRLSSAEWASALAEQLLPRTRTGAAVVLACDEEAIRATGRAAGLDPAHAVTALAAAVRASGGLSQAAQAAHDFARLPAPRPVPPHLPALALLVLAAARMGKGELATQAYYKRLAALVGAPDRDDHPPYSGFAELCGAGFETLARWLAEDEAGTRGELSLPDEPWPRWVGTPVSQVALRSADRRWLGTFFAERARQLDAGWDPAGTLLHHPVRHRLTKPARALLADPRSRPLLSAALLASRASWDGSTYEPDGRRVLASRLFAAIDPLGDGLALTLRADGLGETCSGTGPDGSSTVVPCPPELLAVPLEWTEHAASGPARVVLEDGRALHALPGPLVLFEVAQLGLQQVAAAASETVWALTCRPDVQGGEAVACTLPQGWRLLADVDPAALPDDARGPDPRHDSRSRGLRITSGLPLGDGAWFAGAPPAVAGPAEVDQELLVDGRPSGRLRGGRPHVPTELTDRDGLARLQAGELSLDVLMVARGTRAGYGSVGWRLDDPAHAAAGAIADLPVGPLPRVAGALISGGEIPADRPQGPWCRLQGTVWALRADGRCELTRPPEAEPWQQAVGYGPGARWRLPEGTVWACQPQLRTVRLVDPVHSVDPLGPDVAEVVAMCEPARVVGAPTAIGQWHRLLAAAREVPVA